MGKYYLSKEYRNMGLFELEEDPQNDYYVEYATKLEAAQEFINNKYIYHMTSIGNLNSIISAGGFLPKNVLAERNITYKNIAFNDIQNRRDNINVNDGGVIFNVHDCVPFYFSDRTPMALSVTSRKVIDQREIVYFLLPMQVLRQENVVFSEKALNSNSIGTVYRGIEFLFNINWNLVNSSAYGFSNEEKPYKMAEVLYHGNVTLNQFAKCVVFDNEAKAKVQKIFSDNNINLSVITSREMYSYGDTFMYHFYYYKYFFSDSRKYESLFTGPNELLHLCKETIGRIIDNRNKNGNKNSNYRTESMDAFLFMLQADFASLKELKDLVGLRTDNEQHVNTVDVHTKNVVNNLDSVPKYVEMNAREQMLLKVAAYLHDIGKGPKEKWKNGVQQVYNDHPVDSLRMLERILSSEIGGLTEKEIRLLCILVAYHDILGDVFLKEESRRRNKEEYDTVIREFKVEPRELEMLKVLSLADVKDINEGWYGSMLQISL